MFGLRKWGKGGKSGQAHGKAAKTQKSAKTARARSQSARFGRSKSPIRTERKLFHGVSIHPDSSSGCEAASALENVRFLADEAPMLPLSDCSNPAGCRCRYQHYDDRRTDARRESDVGLPMKHHPNDARTGVGRRVTDS
jgi:hypothetical protein